MVDGRAYHQLCPAVSPGDRARSRSVPGLQRSCTLVAKPAPVARAVGEHGLRLQPPPPGRLEHVSEAVVVVPYEEEWPKLFNDVGRRLRYELGDLVLRVDHVGSTSVPGLDAKPVIDVQVSVASFEALDAFRLPLERAGFVYRPGAELTKRCFRERPGDRRTHVHVRRAGSFNEQFALLFRDFLRSHPGRAASYAALKYSLAAKFSTPEQRYEYVKAKGRFIWETMQLADDWAGEVGWEPGPSDA
jgi:GrpB-like predicted nucleotidyltransferase (UPF0157 family)